MKLKDILSVLPKYDNNYTKGYYKNGNYKGVSVIYLNKHKYREIDMNNIEDFFLEWTVVRIEPYAKSWNNGGIRIYLKGEMNGI